MSYRSNSDSKSKKSSHTTSRPSQGQGRFSSGRSRRPGGGRRQPREVKKFDPSLFMKKVEEQHVAPVYIPKNCFADFAIADILKENIAFKGYTTPTPIQDQAIPILLEGQDIIATANTGTGKTAAFLIPLIHHVLTKKIHRVLIIAPTRELAAQIQAELNVFKNKTGLASALCIGGVNIDPQIQILKRKPQFVVGTPGRLKDLEEQGAISFRDFDALVLDEVDTMLDMGFIRDIRYIMAKMPAKRHSLFFSATISPEIRRLMGEFLVNPASISVKTRQSAENVNQDVIHVDPTKKIDALHDLLIKPGFNKVIIFVRTKRSADKLSKILRERGFVLSTIHGDKTQAQRKKALELFKDNRVKILLATDVVARGIDIDDVTHVINFDLPQSYEDYIHRIGRTGRADKIGQAITFIE